MTIFRYDKTFEGLLSVVFDAYTLKRFPDALQSGDADGRPGLLGMAPAHQVRTEPDKAARVWAGLKKRLFPEGRRRVVYGWLAETEGCDLLLARFMRKVFDAKSPPGAVEMNFADKDVLALARLARQVAHDAQLMAGFARFQKTAQGVYVALIGPRHNIVPLLVPHFRDRFAEHPWILYDVGRGYGLLWDKAALRDVTLDPEVLRGGRLDDGLLAENEAMFQSFWRSYCKVTAISARLNPELQRRLMPRRYWPYMTEMQEARTRGTSGSSAPHALAGFDSGNGAAPADAVSG